MPSFDKKIGYQGVDVLADHVVASFGDADYSQPFWHVDRINLRSGAEPSSMTISIPTDMLGGVAPMIAGLPYATGPLSNAKIWKVCKAVLSGEIIFSGSVVVIDENFDKDAATIEVFDKRYEMEGCVIVGSFWIQDRSGGGCKYRQSIPAWFNKNGNPNRVRGYDGLTYAFCEENFGLADGEVPPDPTTNPEFKATHWTPDSITTYLREATTKSIVSNMVPVGSFLEYSWLPDGIVFPPALAEALKSFSSDATTPALGVAKADEVIFHATPLNLALEHLFKMAGPFTLGTSFGTDGKTTLTCVRTRGGAGGAKVLQRASGDAVTAYVKDGVVIGGGIKRDARRLFPVSIVSGKPVYVETRMASTNSETIADQQAAGVELLTAWDKNITKDIIAAYNKELCEGHTPDIARVLQRYDLAFAAWRLNPTKDFNSGTSEAAFPFCSTTNRIALSHLLSRYQATVAGTDGKTTFELKQGFYPIALEIAKTVADAPTPSGTAQKPAQNDSNGTPPPESGTNMPPPSTDPSTYAPDTGRGGDNYQPDVPGTSNTPSTPPAGEGGGAGTNNRGSAPAQPQDE